MGCSPWGHEESDMTERLSFHFSLSKKRKSKAIFPGGSEVKVSAWNAGDLGSIPGLGRSPGKGNSQSSPRGTKRPIQDKPKETHQDTY